MNTLIQQFNSLHGVSTKREKLEEILTLAKRHNHTGIIFRLSKVLNDNPDADNFKLEIEQYPTGLNAPRHTGSYKVALDECGRLRKGFKFENGTVVKVEPKQKPNAQKGAKPKDKVSKVVHKVEKTIKPTRTNVPEVKEASKTPRKSKASNYGKKTTRVKKPTPSVTDGAVIVLRGTHKKTPYVIYRKLRKNSKTRVVYFGLVNGKRINTTNYARRYDAVNVTERYIQLKFIEGTKTAPFTLTKNRVPKVEKKEPQVNVLNAPVEKIIIPVAQEIQTEVVPVNPVQHQEQKKYVPEQPKPVFQPDEVQEEITQKLTSGARRLLETDFEVLPIDDEWSELMQNPAANLKIAIWGKPKNGKTSGALQLAEYFTNFGKVLYNFADQGFNLSTQVLWKNSGLAENENAEPSDIDTLEALEKEIASGDYRFVFIDMISDYIRKEKLKPEEFKERFIKRYPNVSFILIFEVTKSGDFKGDQGWTHIVDAIMTVENFLIENTGRYGNGERIIWEEGFAKKNPKRYQELMEERETENMETAPVEKIVIN